jgi:hypothetical protein
MISEQFTDPIKVSPDGVIAVLRHDKEDKKNACERVFTEPLTEPFR